MRLANLGLECQHSHLKVGPELHSSLLHARAKSDMAQDGVLPTQPAASLAICNAAKRQAVNDLTERLAGQHSVKEPEHGDRDGVAVQRIQFLDAHQWRRGRHGCNGIVASRQIEAEKECLVRGSQSSVMQILVRPGSPLIEVAAANGPSRVRRADEDDSCNVYCNYLMTTLRV